jgi:hypothetical protein
MKLKFIYKCNLCFCSFCVFYLIMSVLLSWSPFFSNILLARVIFIIVTHNNLHIVLVQHILRRISNLCLTLMPPHFRARPKPLHDFTTSRHSLPFYNGQWVEVRADCTSVVTGIIVDHHCLSFVKSCNGLGRARKCGGIKVRQRLEILRRICCTSTICKYILFYLILNSLH